MMSRTGWFLTRYRWLLRHQWLASAYGMGPIRMVREWPVRGRLYNWLVRETLR